MGAETLRPARGYSDAAGSSLNDDQRRHFRERGWVIARGFCPAAETATLSAWTEELAGRPERAGAEMVYHETSLADPASRIVQRIENFCPYHEGFDRFVRGRIRAAVEFLLGQAAVLFKDKINFKLPGGAGFEPHQDQQAGWSAYAPLFVTALVSIDPATLENGCLEIADTPRLGRLIGKEWEPLSPSELAGLALEPVPCTPGDVIFFDSFVTHASKPNRSSQARRILYLTYNVASDGDHRERYFRDKRASFPPDIERQPGIEYRFRV